MFILSENNTVILKYLCCFSNKLVHLVADIFRNTKLLALYFIPALLYCLYNNLAFANLATFDPTTYYLLLQLRVVITGVLFQVSNLIYFFYQVYNLLFLSHIMTDIDMYYNLELANMKRVNL